MPCYLAISLLLVVIIKSLVKTQRFYVGQTGELSFFHVGDSSFTITMIKFSEILRHI